MKKITRRQFDLLKYMVRYHDSNGKCPDVWSVARSTWLSVPDIVRSVNLLEHKKWIKKQSRKIEISNEAFDLVNGSLLEEEWVTE